MLHDVIVSPFLDGYLALRPGSAAGARLPEAGYEELRALAGTNGLAPSWFADTAASLWGLEMSGTPVSKAVLVRERSSYGFSKASWEINLGCNFACTHCYLGLKEFSGLTWPEKVRLLDIMRDAGVLWLQTCRVHSGERPPGSLPGAFPMPHRGEVQLPHGTRP